MFARDSKNNTKLSGSPSFLFNNLSSAKNGTLAYIRLNEILVTKDNGEAKRVPISKFKVYQVKYLEMPDATVLAVLSNQGIQLWSADGEQMLFYYALSTSLGNEMEDSRFMCGVTTDGKFLYAGCSTGNILIFDCIGGVGKANFPLYHCLDSHRQAIYALSCSKSILTAANDCGTIFFYNSASAFESIKTIEGNGVPCTALAQTEDVAIAGFASGHIRFYRLDVPELSIEVCAHARMISAMSLDPSNQLLLSCSPDQYVHVWSIPTFRSKANSTVGCIFTDHLENSACTGVAFNGEYKFYVANYDEDELTVYARS